MACKQERDLKGKAEAGWNGISCFPFSLGPLPHCTGLCHAAHVRYELRTEEVRNFLHNDGEIDAGGMLVGFKVRTPALCLHGTILFNKTNTG